MTPGGHLVTTAAACAAVQAGTGSVELTAGLAAGGFLIDLDHAVDYLLFDRRRDLRPGAFLRHYTEGRFERVVLLLHSYELFAALAAVAWLTDWVWCWGVLLGMALHLPLDVVFNGRYEPGGLVAFYSFAYRCRHGFQARRLLTGAYAGPAPAGFLAAFFCGPEVRRPRSAPAPRAGLARPSPAGPLS